MVTRCWCNVVLSHLITIERVYWQFLQKKGLQIYVAYPGLDYPFDCIQFCL